MFIVNYIKRKLIKNHTAKQHYYEAFVKFWDKEEHLLRVKQISKKSDKHELHCRLLESIQSKFYCEGKQAVMVKWLTYAR